MTEEKKEFPQGIIFKKPRENAPDFVKGSLSFKVDEFTEYLANKANNGWVNLDLKVSKGGNLYLDLNDWKPENKTEIPKPANSEPIPF